MRLHVPPLISAAFVLLVPVAQPAGFEFAKSCVVPKGSNPGGDDSPGITAAIYGCGNNTRIVFQEGTTYNILTPLRLTNLHNVELVFEGNLTMSENVAAVQDIVRNSRVFPGQWIQIRGDRVNLTGSVKPDAGWFVGSCHYLSPQLHHGQRRRSNLTFRPRRPLVG